MIYKGYDIVGGFGSSKLIKPVGRGSVPLELRGMYVSLGDAQKGIDMFLTIKESRGGKIKSKSNRV